MPIMTQLQMQENGTKPNSEVSPLPQHGRIVLPDLKAHLIFWPLMVVGFALDLCSKKVVFDWLARRQHDSIRLIDGVLRLVAAENTGAAFGIAAGQRCLLISVSTIALLIILAIFLFGGIERKLIYAVLGIFAAGVSGNLWDRIFNDGRVRDFIDVVYWPAFNVADSMLCITVVFLIVFSLSTGKSSQKRAQQHK